jgi:hypothetical protein
MRKRRKEEKSRSKKERIRIRNWVAKKLIVLVFFFLFFQFSFVAIYLFIYSLTHSFHFLKQIIPHTWCCEPSNPFCLSGMFHLKGSLIPHSPSPTHHLLLIFPLLPYSLFLLLLPLHRRLRSFNTPSYCHYPACLSSA